jgi:hypothetical protein
MTVKEFILGILIDQRWSIDSSKKEISYVGNDTTYDWGFFYGSFEETLKWAEEMPKRTCNIAGIVVTDVVTTFYYPKGGYSSAESDVEYVRTIKFPKKFDIKGFLNRNPALTKGKDYLITEFQC